MPDTFLSGRSRCRHRIAGGCPLCLFPDDSFEPVYRGTEIPRTPPSRMEIEAASSDVWTREKPRRWLTKSKEGS